MTKHVRPAPRRRRLSRRALRTWAWIAGGAALFAPLGALAAQPKVATVAAASRPRPVVIHKVLRRVVVVAPQAKTPPPQIVYTGGGSSGSGSGGAAPVTTTGGS